MDKRLAKRHKRQADRAKAKIRISEPDVRTHEQIEAAREASRANSGTSGGPKLAGPSTSHRNSRATSTGSAAKSDG